MAIWMALIMAIAFIAGTAKTNTAAPGRTGDGNLTVDFPAGYTPTAGHFALIILYNDQGDGSTPTDWTEITGSPWGSATPKLCGFCKVLAGGESAPVTTISGSGTNVSHCANMAIYSGVDGTTPIDAVGTASAGDGTEMTAGGIDPPTDNAMALALCGLGDNHDAGGQTFGGSATGVTERLDGGTNQGNDSQVSMYDKLIASGATGNGYALTTTDPWVSVIIALKAAASNYTDSGTMTAAGVHAGADTAQRVDAGSMIVAGVATGSEVYGHTDAGSVVGIAVSTGMEVYGHTDAGSVVGAGVLVGADTAQRVDAGAMIAGALGLGSDQATSLDSGAMVAAGIVTGEDVCGFVDAGDMIAVGVSAGEDIYTPAGGDYTDAGTMAASAAIVGADLAATSDAGTAAGIAAGGGADFSATLDAGSASGLAIAGGVDVYARADPVNYLDAGTAVAIATASGIDSLGLIPVGPLTASLAGLRRVLAESADFQEFVGAGNQAEAEAKIHLFDFEAEPAALAADRSMATIWLADNFHMDVVAWGDRAMLDPGGDLVLELQAADEAPADRAEGVWAFLESIEKVLSALRDRAAADDYLTVRQVRFLWGPRRSPPQDDPSTGGYWHCGLVVSWGAGGGRA